MSTAPLCRDCGQTIVQQEEKALDGEVQIVWTDPVGRWVCPVTGNEHEPGEPRHSVTVTVKFGGYESIVRLSLAEAGTFVFNPITMALDDGESAWHLQEADPERFAEIEGWSRGLYGLVGTEAD